MKTFKLFDYYMKIVISIVQGISKHKDIISKKRYSHKNVMLIERYDYLQSVTLKEFHFKINDFTKCYS